MATAPLLLLALITLALLFWFETLRMREYVIRHCKRICESSGYQLLDESIALASISLRRDRNGRLRIHRSYQFHVSEDGADRYRGHMLLTGRHIEAVHIDSAGGTTILHEERPMQLH